MSWWTAGALRGDLHDHVIQRLFAAGLSLQSIASTVNDEIIAQRLTRIVNELDETIQQIRSTIFALREDSSRSLRGAALAIVDQLAPVLPARPDIQLVGPLDTVVDDFIIGDVEAVLRESLTNVAKHAQATKVRVWVQADGRRLALTVTDDGIGLGQSTRRSGLANLQRRAERYGGDFSVGNAPEGGSAAAMVDPASPVTSVKPIRVFILDDHELVRRGLTDLLTATNDLIIVGEAATAADALHRIPAAAPDVALLDARLPDGSGIDVCREIRSSHENIRCLILTSYDDDEALFSAVMAGASGYLLKQIGGNSLVEGIRQVAAGRSLLDPAVTEKLLNRLRNPVEADPLASSLTAREREILDLIADGCTNRQIGERLFLAEKTVKNYVSGLLTKLGMQRRTQAAVYGATLRRQTGGKSPGSA